MRLPQAGYVMHIAAGIAAIGALLIGEHVYLREYLTTDENSYLFQAWIFLQGELRLETPPLKEAFFHRMIIADANVGWLSRYPPAHSIWLMPGVALGYPRLMTAVAAFLSVWFIAKGGERLKIPTWLSCGLLLFSPYFWLMQGTVLSHTSGLAATAILMWAYIAWLQERKICFAAIAGLAWAFLFLNRTYTAFWIAIPFGVDALVRLYRSRNRLTFIGTTVFAACAAVGVALYLIYNAAITGDPFLPTYLYYDLARESGFFIGQSAQDIQGHTLARGLGFTWNNVLTLNTRLWGFPGSLIILAMLTVVAWKKSLAPLMLAAAALVWLGYAAFWFEGIPLVAPVYYYETLVFIILLAGLGAHRLLSVAWRLPKWSKPVAGCVIVALVGAFAAHTFAVCADEIRQRSAVKRAYQQVIRAVPPGSIVALRRVPKDILDEASWNPHGLESDPLIMREGFGIRHPVRHLFPDRPLYLVTGDEPLPAKRIQNLGGIIPAIPAETMRAATGMRELQEGDIRYLAYQPLHSEGALGLDAGRYLIPGTYEVKFFLEAAGNEGEPVGAVKVVADFGEQVLVERVLMPGDSDVELIVEVDRIRIAEPRVYFSGRGRLVFDRVEVRWVGGG